MEGYYINIQYYTGSLLIYNIYSPIGHTKSQTFRYLIRHDLAMFIFVFSYDSALSALPLPEFRRLRYIEHNRMISKSQSKNCR